MTNTDYQNEIEDICRRDGYWNEESLQAQVKDIMALLQQSNREVEDKPFVEYEDASADLHELEDWEIEFHSRFGGYKFLPYITPSRVRKFIRKQLTHTEEDSCKHTTKEEWTGEYDSRTNQYKLYVDRCINCKQTIGEPHT